MKSIYLILALITAIARCPGEDTTFSHNPDLGALQPIVWEDSESDKAIVAILQPKATSPEQISGVLAGVVTSFLKAGTANPTVVGIMKVHSCEGFFIRGDEFDSDGRELLSLVIFTEKSTLLIQARGTTLPNRKELEKIVEIDGEPLEIAVPIVTKSANTFGNNIPKMQLLVAEVRESNISEPAD